MPLLGSLLMTCFRFGRRLTLLLAAIPSAAGWIVMARAEDSFSLLLGRLATGLGTGAYTVVCPIYVTEVSSASLRGWLGTYFQLSIVSGILLMYAAGGWLGWQTLAIIGCCLSCLTGLAALLVLRDTPISYLARGRTAAARKTLVWLRATGEIEDELTNLQRAGDEAKRGSRMSTRAVLSSSEPSIRRPVVLVLFLMAAQQLSGINAVIAYTVDIFRVAGASWIDPNSATILVGVVQMAATSISVWLVGRAGRRRTLILTNVAMAACLFAMGSNSWSWLPPISLAAFVCAFSLGPGPLTWLLLGELLPPRAAGAAAGTVAAFNWLLAFAVTAGVGHLQSALGQSGSFYAFAAMALVSALGIWRWLPETKGKTLREVQEAFRK